MACAGAGGCSIDSPCISQTDAESLCGCVQTEASKVTTLEICAVLGRSPPCDLSVQFAWMLP